MGYHPSEVELMALCFFEEIQEPRSEKQLKGVRGIVALTDSEVCLMNGAIGIAPTRHLFKFPISEIESVSGFADQVQIRHQDKLYVMSAFNWEDFRANSALTTHIYRSLVAANVPEFETQEHYSWTMLSSRRSPYSNSHSHHDNPPTNYENSIGAILSQERARDREIERSLGKWD